jgi:hypothetical protein
MISLTLSPEEADVLRDAVSTYQHTLLHEIAKAHSLDFRQVLRNREAVVSKLLAQLAPSSVS